MVELTNLSTEELRELKKEISDELGKRHQAKQEKKLVCWLCSDCFWDDNAHPSYYKGNRGGSKCMAWNEKGRLITTKHKAPSWCPKMKGE